MRKIYLILAAISILTTNATAQLKSRKIDTVMSYYNQLLQYNGSILVAEKGKPIIHKGYGYSIVEKEMVCDTNTYFQVGAITQTFTSTLVLMLHEQKKLNINDKLSKYFPDYPNGDDITIEHLLTHTSGIYNYTDSADFMQMNVMIPITHEDLMGLFQNKALAFKPGTQYSFSNSNYILLGYIIEQVTSKSYFEVARTMILDSLGMKNTGFAFNTFPSWDKAQGHFLLRYGRLMPAPVVDSTVSAAAGSMFTTTTDLYTWTKAVLNKRLLSAKMWQKALTPYKGDYGYGWKITNDTLTGKKTIGHSGITQGFVSDLLIFPEDSTAIILLSNDMGDDHEPVLYDLKAILYDKPYTLPQLQQVENLPEEKLREYEGMYSISKTTNLRVYYEQGVIKGLILGQDPFTMLPEGNDSFFLTNVDTKIRFVRNKEGKVSSLIIKNLGKEVEAEKWR